MTTWVYDGTSFTPVAKLTDEDTYSIVQDYLGTPIQAFDSKGKVVWDCILDIYGKVYKLHGDTGFISFRYQGQYEDEDTGLYYNRFRYYSPDMGMYISQDPIGLEGGNPTLYGYVFDTNTEVDILGLDLHHIIPQQIYKQFKTAFDSVEGYVQNISKKATDISNLIDLDKSFHGNHPKYNDYVRKEVKKNHLGTDYDTPTFHFDKDSYIPGSHEKLHKYQDPFVGGRQGKFNGTADELLSASRKGLVGVDNIKGDLKIPRTGETLAKNVTPLEAFDKLMERHKEKIKTVCL